MTRENGTASFAYLDPFAPVGTPPDPYLPRLRDTNGAVRIALASNLFTDATAFLDDLRGPLAGLLSGCKFVTYDKENRRNSSAPFPDERIEMIAAECDVVVAAFGHCGSCSAGIVRDAVSFARAGLPVVTLVTSKFIEETAFVARAAGIPDVPLLYLEHPIAGRDADYHRRMADEIAPLIVAGWRSGKVPSTVFGTKPALDVAA